MAFESLTERLNKAMKTITGKGKLTEANMNDMLKEVRMSLLEADVNYKVVKDFVASVKEKAMGEKVLDSLDPGQQVVMIVRDELQKLLGQEDAKIHFNDSGITSIMMVGLQGTGKTTASAKIARFAKNKLKKKVLLAACDVVRPAAIEQLQTLGKQIDVEVFSLGPQESAVHTASEAMKYAEEKGFDMIIFDTAGRLHIDEDLMNELREMKELIRPQEILLTVDAMTGQDIVTVAREFNDQLQITGLVVTKMDGDARGGGLLSVRSITDVPVLFVSSGEKVDDLEEFHPDRMAERILGMGDILTLIEQAQDRMNEEKAKKTQDRMMAGIFTFEDMLDQLEQLSHMGSMSGMLKMIPGFSKMAKMIDDDKINAYSKQASAIINSMTPFERNHPEVLKAGRKSRIAKGAGVKVADVNRIIQARDQMASVARGLNGMKTGRMNPFAGLGGMGGNAMGGLPKGFGPGIPNGSRHSGSKKVKASKKKKKKK